MTDSNNRPYFGALIIIVLTIYPAYRKRHLSHPLPFLPSYHLTDDSLGRIRRVQQRADSPGLHLTVPDRSC